MGLARSTYYDEPAGQPIEDARLVERIKEMCAEWPCYRYRRVTVQLHAEGMFANHKKVMRLMREHGLWHQFPVRPSRGLRQRTELHRPQRCPDAALWMRWSIMRAEPSPPRLARCP